MTKGVLDKGGIKITIKDKIRKTLGIKIRIHVEICRFEQNWKVHEARILPDVQTIKISNEDSKMRF